MSTHLALGGPISRVSIPASGGAIAEGDVGRDVQSALARWVQLAPAPQWERKGLQLNPEEEDLSRQRNAGAGRALQWAEKQERRRRGWKVSREQTVERSEGVLMDQGPQKSAGTWWYFSSWPGQGPQARCDSLNCAFTFHAPFCLFELLYNRDKYLLQG